MPKKEKTTRLVCCEKNVDTVVFGFVGWYKKEAAALLR